MRIHKGFLFAAVLLSLDRSAAAVLNVPADHPTVQMAIDAANARDTIQIAPGEYVESLAISNKDLTLRGEGFLQTILRSPAASDFTLTVAGAAVTLRDLRFEGLALNQFFTKQAINAAAHDFIGLVSQTPIRRFEFDFVSGPGFDGDNLLFTRILTLTPPGMNIAVQPVDTRTGASPVTVTFGEVTGGGSIGLTTSANGPPGPTSFQICNPPVYYDLTTTAMTAEGSTIEVCIDYTGLGCNPLTVAIHHFEDTDSDGLPDAWVDVTSSHDMVNHIICGTVDSLSFFGLFQPALFRRGDANADGRIDIADPIYSVQWLFLGGPEPPCLEAANANDSSGVDISDAIYFVQYLFLGGPPPPAPFPACGLAQETPDCRSYPPCP